MGTIHLFKEGSFITLCCHQHALDTRLEVGTYEPEAATCDGVLPKPTESE